MDIKCNHLKIKETHVENARHFKLMYVNHG